MTCRIADVSSGRENNFNLIRAIAATAVIVSHAFPLTYGLGTPEPLEAWLDGTTLGTVAVLVFFAVSGFFITRSFDTRNDPVAFLTARALRLFPALAVVLLITVLVASLFTSAAPGVYWPAAVTYWLHNMSLFSLRYVLPGIFETAPFGPAINGPLWTLAYEVMCYVGVFLLGMLGLLRNRMAIAGLLALFVLAYAAAQVTELPGRVEMLLRLGLPFAIGAAFWVWRDRVPLSLPLAILLAVLAVLCHGTPVFLAVFSLALSYVVFVLGYWPSDFLQRYNRLGDYSYGIYIWGFPVQQIGAVIGLDTALANIAFTLPIVLALSVASWHLIEGPALRLKSFRRRPSPA